MNTRRRFLLDELFKPENTKEKCIIESFDEFLFKKHLIREDLRKQRLQKIINRLYEEKTIVNNVVNKSQQRDFMYFVLMNAEKNTTRLKILYPILE